MDEMRDELLFLGMDIPTAVKNVLSNQEKQATDGMTTEEQRAYQIGVDKTLRVLSQLVKSEEHFVVHIDKMTPTDMTFSELLSVNVDKMLSYTE